jgi:hypothetical protein
MSRNWLDLDDRMGIAATLDAYNQEPFNSAAPGGLVPSPITWLPFMEHASRVGCSSGPIEDYRFCRSCGRACNRPGVDLCDACERDEEADQGEEE